MSKYGNPKRWLAVAALTLAMCAFSVAQPDKDKHRGGHGGDDWCRTAKCQQVPDGGSTAGYLLTAGAVCLGALFVHTRRRRSLSA
jgi:hypothetical protein